MSGPPRTHTNTCMRTNAPTHVRTHTRTHMRTHPHTPCLTLGINRLEVRGQEKGTWQGDHSSNIILKPLDTHPAKGLVLFYE